MPKETFFNLKKEKRKFITDAFLREFALKIYDDASISEVVKQLGIAKGSIYQYFDDKLDLFMYLLKESGEIKRGYLERVKREKFPDFWDFFRALYLAGLEFDKGSPLHSHFLYKLIDNLKSPTIGPLYQTMLKETVSAFETMTIVEIEKRLFRDDIDSDVMAFMLYKVGASIQEQMEFKGIVKPAESVLKSEPVYLNKEESLMAMVDAYIELVRPSFDKR